MFAARLSTIGARVARQAVASRLHHTLAQQSCRIQFTSSRSIATSQTISPFQPLSSIRKPLCVANPVNISSMLRPVPFTTPARFFHPKKAINKKKARVGYRFRPHHASLKRYRPLADGTILRFKSGMNHKRRRKSKRQLRRLSKKVTLPATHYRRARLMMGLKRLPKPLPRRKYDHPVH